MTLTHGLFVTTPIEPGLMNYAILAENSIFPIDYHFYPSQNTTVDPVWEVAAVPKPIFQRRITTPRVDHYVLFASSNDIPGFPAMWGRENHALHFGVVPGKPGGALLMQGHGRGGSFLYAAYGTGRTDETVIAADDYLPTWDVSSFYLGYNNTYDPAVGNNPPASGGAVFDYTDRFVLYVMDWAKANYGYDEHRVYALGGSMGGSFAFFLAWHHPERIAAAFAVVP
jgi:hypothetical protein